MTEEHRNDRRITRQRPCIGPAVRRLRRERGLTLADVAGRTGLNIGYLSQVETDKASPSLETLAALGDALTVPVAWFFLDAAAPPRVVRVAERPARDGVGGAGRIEEVDGGAARDVRIVEATIPAGARTGFHAHAGDEHHLVLAGRVRLAQGDHVVELGPGDYLVWDATIPHDAEAIGNEPARLLIVGHRAHGPETSQPEPPRPS
ncbi:MAG TPA: XRE family transcriptional regulator [Candidatus Limnocylindrales bacterium]|nr:XRE family transcriptional regulator [Candidatus Limnocylindrales bacterium]